MAKKINFAILFYIINILVGVFGILLHYEANPIFGYIFSIVQIVFYAFGGYLNAKNDKKIQSICWIGLFNLLTGLASIFAIEVLGAHFNFLGGSSDSYLIILIHYSINLYLYPFLELLENINEILPIIFVVFCSFLFPLFGYCIGKFLHPSKKE